MTDVTVRAPPVQQPPDDTGIAVTEAATMDARDVLARLSSATDGLTVAEAARRLAVVGPNAVRTHGARPLGVLVRQLRSPLLLLLAATAAASFFLGQRADAVIIGSILVVSVGLGFVNEFRAEQAAEALHEQIRHRTVVVRGGTPIPVDVTGLVPGDVVELETGSVVPADLRLLSTSALECDETVLTGEAVPVAKDPRPVAAGAALGDLSCAALMGSVVRAGAGRGVVVATGGRSQFGSIALALGERPAETEFQVGLRAFSLLLVRVAAILSTSVFVINVALHRPTLEALLFALAIAVGVTPQLLPAIVSTSLSAGSRELARHKVLVKRLVCIEDLGNMQVLCTDKTGTLTQGRISFMRSVGADGRPSTPALVFGLLCNDTTSAGAATSGSHVLDNALWASPAAGPHRAEVALWQRLATLPFDHDRRLISVVVDDGDGHRLLVTKGAPEVVLDRCRQVPRGASDVLEAEFGAGGRVVAVASREWNAQSTTLQQADEHDLSLVGFLVFVDAPKTSALPALRRLHGLGVEVKVVTGDNALVAATVCSALDLPVRGTLTGGDVERMDDDGLAAAVTATTVFARVSPDDKARIVRALRRHGLDTAFLGDGVNDAVALHAADVGVAVDSGADVAKDAADIILLEKDLNVLADGVVAGRRIFANTVKYVLMSTSSNFGNMFSAAAASAVLPFLPMLPSQVLLNNMLYDTSQLAIPTDNVDDEQLARPAHWDIGLIRRFMLFFGPISSVFDFATFAVLLWVFNASAALFRSGWFIESLATQTLVVFVIRTRRVFFRSRPSAPLVVAAVGVVGVGALLPFTPLAHDLHFAHPSGTLMLVIVAMVLVYMALVEIAKQHFFRTMPPTPPMPREPARRRLHRRAARFSSRGAPVAARRPRRTVGERR